MNAGVPQTTYDRVSKDQVDQIVKYLTAHVGPGSKPRDLKTDPLIRDEEALSQALYINVFTDAGHVYQCVREYNPTRRLSSVGFGAAVISPLGPIGLDLGYGLDKTDALGASKPGWQLHFRLGNFF